MTTFILFSPFQLVDWDKAGQHRKVWTQNRLPSIPPQSRLNSCKYSIFLRVNESIIIQIWLKSSNFKIDSFYKQKLTKKVNTCLLKTFINLSFTHTSVLLLQPPTNVLNIWIPLKLIQIISSPKCPSPHFTKQLPLWSSKSDHPHPSSALLGLQGHRHTKDSDTHTQVSWKSQYPALTDWLAMELKLTSHRPHTQTHPSTTVTTLQACPSPFAMLHLRVSPVSTLSRLQKVAVSCCQNGETSTWME